MQVTDKKMISAQTIVNAPIDKVWKKWNNPNDIVKWNNASDDWHTTKAENDLRIGGKFLSRMEAKDGSMAFDFEGVYDAIKNNEYIEYTITDGRKVKISFTAQDGKTKVVEAFEPEDENSIELQHDGWQSIMDSFKKYTEEN